jgi:hypothetical protein
VRRIAVLTVKLLAVAIATFAVFRAGALWSSRALLQAQHFGSPNAALDPLLAHFTRYAIGVLWPIPGAAMLFLAAGGFERGKRWWWPLLLVALGWLAATWIVQGPQVYYYWLTPQQ